MLDLVS